MVKSVILFFSLVVVFYSQAQPSYDYSKLKKERLGRGLVVVKKDQNTNFVTWRYFSSDAKNVSFNLYRNGLKINKAPISRSTSFEDKYASIDQTTYTVKSIVNKKEQELQTYTLPANAPVGYINIPLDVPKAGITKDGEEYTYVANDASIGDVDGDGEYEIFLKWDPTNAHDNSHKGFTANVYIDCIKLDGTKLWRIDLGRNIRAGAHYTQFMVFDFDHDGIAEIVMKTADGTVDSKGKVIGDAKADYRNANGYIIEGPEFLTVFDGKSGEEVHTIEYVPVRGDWQAWGDNYGNRVDRFLAAVAYLDGENPSVVMCRGYYTRAVLAAFDYKNKKLVQRWVFDSETPGNESYRAQGNHNLRVGDVDGDGKDEIVYGQCTINDDGTGLYSTKMGHGDAIHMTVFDPTRKGMQVWGVHENKKDGSSYRDAATGEVLFQLKSSSDVGRGMAADIDPRHAGVEMWSWASDGIRNIKGETISKNVTVQTKPTDSSSYILSVNMAVWWDGDLSRELLDKNRITKYDYLNDKMDLLLEAEGAVSNNGTKATPAVQGDLYGDWREEVLLRTEDNKNLRLYVSTHSTDYRFHSFLEDPVYRISIATQNVSYNQPTQSGFYFGTDLGKIFKEKELVVKGSSITLDAGMDYDSYVWSFGGKERSKTFSTKDFKKRTKVELKVTFRGREFSDYVYITFKP